MIYEFVEGSEKKKFVVSSATPPFLYQDFEILKKIKN